MCGIAGIITPNAENYKEPLQRMVNALHHRGPDENGTHYFPNCALGHSRLSIVDLEKGQQPMLSPNKKISITFNGEIYGYQTIKERLSDYPFKTHSDTEIILALYQRYGKDLMPHLPGMFAFAIWDESKQELFCGRDRFGEKPFYYAIGHNKEFIFASEIKALLATELITPSVNPKAMMHYLRHLYVHPHQTIYKNIYILPSSHTLSYKKGEIKVERYWSLPVTDVKIQMNEAIEQFKKLFKQAVQRQLIADVPVATFLSGGMDSSSITAIASEYYPNLKTMSFGFDGDLNELPYAMDVKNKFQTEHIELTDKEVKIEDLLLKMTEVYDEPFADSSNIPMYLMSQLARQHTKVILTGDGGDELLGGYTHWYRPLFLMEQQKSLWDIKIIFAKLMTKLFLSRETFQSQVWQDKIKGWSYRKKYNSIIKMHQTQNCYFNDEELSLLGLKVFNEYDKFDCSWNESNTVDDALRMDLENYMAGDILVKTDRASMAHGLELRSPFLDKDFASFCISLPSSLKINTETDKLVLRKALSDTLPLSVQNRKKQGFGAPVSQWLKRKGVKDLKEEYLNKPNKKIFNLMSFENSQTIVEQDNYQTWILLVLSLWMEKYA